mgnify:CR=1 FL=1
MSEQSNRKQAPDVGSLYQEATAIARIIKQGQEAWRRLKKSKSWNDWIMVGDALVVGRNWAMRQAGTNRPEGKGYNMAMAEWLTRNKLDDIDKSHRSRLIDCIENLGAIEEWRATLTLGQRLTWNHPNIIWMHWRKAIEPAPVANPDSPPKPTLRDSVAELSEENARLKAHVAELEAARNAAQEELDGLQAELESDMVRITCPHCGKPVNAYD